MAIGGWPEFVHMAAGQESNRARGSHVGPGSEPATMTSVALYESNLVTQQFHIQRRVPDLDGMGYKSILKH